MAGLSVGAVELKVTPEQLIEKSEVVKNQIRSVRNHFDQLQTLVNKSQGYWIGDAGDLYRKTYKDQEDNVERILNRLAEHPMDLIAIARNYTDMEAQVDQIIQSLPGDVLL